jgi:prefoldin subunit 5
MSSYHARKIFFLSVASIIASIIIMPLGHSVYAQTSTNQSKESLKDQQPYKF